MVDAPVRQTEKVVSAVELVYSNPQLSVKAQADSLVSTVAGSE
jgi:hypothetical protein